MNDKPEKKGYVLEGGAALNDGTIKVLDYFIHNSLNVWMAGRKFLL